MLTTEVNDTIVAIATPMGESGIGIVRMSGKNALAIADKVFQAKSKEKLFNFKTYSVHYGWIIDSSLQKDTSPATAVVDEVLLTVMRQPRSFTKEDVVEINCHGGIVALRRVLEVLLENGARLAQPGEFTKRAFLNGRIDLAQAEAVLDIIKAKTDSALRIGLEQLKGNLSGEIGRIREALLDILMRIEAAIDFPEDVSPASSAQEYKRGLEDVQKKLDTLIVSYARGRIYREGIHVVICGRPNVGKSSLLNAFLKKERSIVTPIAGTTRDTIEEIIDIQGIPVRIVDTAGLIEPRDLVEEKAIARSKKHIEQADVILLIFENNRRLTPQDELLMKKLKRKQVIVVINKIDLGSRIEKERIEKHFRHLVCVSAKKMKNIGALEDMLVQLVYKGAIKSTESALVSTQRHIQPLKKAQKCVAQAVNSLDNNLSLEFAGQDIKYALKELDIVLGKTFSEDLLEKIFSEFCIGK